jgi:hypothetical protein
MIRCHSGLRAGISVLTRFRVPVHSTGHGKPGMTRWAKSSTKELK